MPINEISGVIYPDQSGLIKGLESVGQNIRYQQAIDRENQKRNEDFLLKFSDYDPVVSVSRRNQQAQEQMLNSVRESTAQILSKYDIKKPLPIEVKMDLQRRWDGLLNWQNKVKTDEQAYVKARQKTLDDPGKYDIKKWEMAEKMYIDEGIVPPEGFLTPRPINFDLWLQNRRDFVGTKIQNKVTERINGEDKIAIVTDYGTPQEKDAFIENSIFEDQTLMSSVSQAFVDRPYNVQQEYYNKANISNLAKGEKEQKDLAITMWAKDYARDKLRNPFNVPQKIFEEKPSPIGSTFGGRKLKQISRIEDSWDHYSDPMRISGSIDVYDAEGNKQKANLKNAYAVRLRYGNIPGTSQTGLYEEVIVPKDKSLDLSGVDLDTPEGQSKFFASMMSSGGYETIYVPEESIRNDLNRNFNFLDIDLYRKKSKQKTIKKDPLGLGL